MCVSWIFFRANSVADAWFLLCRLFAGWGQLLQNALHHKHLNLNIYSMERSELLCCGLLIVALEVVQWLQRRFHLQLCISHAPWYVRWPVYYGAVAAILFFGVFEKRQFIYFQF